jgi:hypothetical protein
VREDEIMRFENENLYLMTEEDLMEFTEQFDFVEPEYIKKQFNEVIVKKTIECEELPGYNIVMIETKTPWVTEEGLDFGTDEVEYYIEDEKGSWIPLDLEEDDIYNNEEGECEE